MDVSGHSGHVHLVLVCAVCCRPRPLLQVNRLCRRMPSAQMGVAKRLFFSYVWWQVLSIRLSVTIRYTDHTGWNTSEIISRTISLGSCLNIGLAGKGKEARGLQRLGGERRARGSLQVSSVMLEWKGASREERGKWGWKGRPGWRGKEEGERNGDWEMGKGNGNLMHSSFFVNLSAMISQCRRSGILLSELDTGDA